MDYFHEIVDELRNTSKKTVLGTLIHVEGSAYLKEGAMILFEDGQHRTGLISAGCVEHDLVCRAHDVIKDGKARRLIYELSGEEDQMWGQGTGCNGTLHVVLELIDDSFKEQMLQAAEKLKQGSAVILVKRLSNDFDFPFVINEFLEMHEEDRINFKGRKNGLVSNKQYIQLILPRQRVVIFGAGPDVPALASFASHTGFFVTICDWRPGLCTKKRFPLAHELILGFPLEIADQVNLRSQDMVVIMSHNFQRDQEFLSFVLEEKVSYLGILGSRERTKRLLKTSNFPSHIRSPVGLSIHAKGPQEIAVSIVAEMIARKHEIILENIPFS